MSVIKENLQIGTDNGAVDGDKSVMIEVLCNDVSLSFESIMNEVTEEISRTMMLPRKIMDRLRKNNGDFF